MRKKIIYLILAGGISVCLLFPLWSLASGYFSQYLYLELSSTVILIPESDERDTETSMVEVSEESRIEDLLDRQDSSQKTSDSSTLTEESEGLADDE